MKTEDYGFSLIDDGTKQSAEGEKKKTRTEGFVSSRFDDDKQEPGVKKKKVKTQDYGFSLVDDEDKQRPEMNEKD